MSFCSLLKGITPENLHIVFCPNKQCSFEPFMCFEGYGLQHKSSTGSKGDRPGGNFARDESEHVTLFKGHRRAKGCSGLNFFI